MAEPGSMLTDNLAELARSGDGHAFTRLWDTHIDSLKSYLRSSIRNLDDFYLGDICSRSFEKAFRQIESFDSSRGSFFTWLKTIAHNTALDLLDKENRLNSKYVRIDDEVGNDAVKDIGADSDSPIDSIIKDEDDALRNACIEGLPELYREVARKRLVEGLSYKEIAEELDLELNTVRTRIRRAKAIIEKMEVEECDD